MTAIIVRFCADCAAGNCRTCLEGEPQPGTPCECEHDDLFGQPWRGMRFWHSRQVDGHGKPVVCGVTAIRQGRVYYRNATGFLSWIALEAFSDSVCGLLPTAGTGPAEPQ